MFEKNFTWAVIIICIFRVSVECKRNRTPVPRFHLSPFRVCALSPCSSSLRFYFFFVARCRYRNPFSLLVRVIRGFKTAFHHQTLERSWRERCHCGRRRERRRRRLRQGRRKWRRREKNFSCWEGSTEWLDANRPASFDGLSVNEEASRSARIYRDCIHYWRLQLPRQASRHWCDVGVPD